MIRFVGQLYRKGLLFAYVLLGLSFHTQVQAASLPEGFIDTPIEGYWPEVAGLTFETNGTMYVWERAGRVWIVENDIRLLAPLIDISDEVGGWIDHGMLGFALDPNFRQNGHFYLLYVVDRHHLTKVGTPQYNPLANEYHQATIGRLTRYTARASDGFRTVDPASRTVLIGETASTGFPILWTTHGIGSLIFAPDGTLLVSCGDGAGLGDYGSDPNSHYAQALSDGIIRPKENIGAFRSQLVDCLNGKILRINPANGNGIASNPFYDPANPRAPRSRVWALGMRNPFRMSLRPGTGSTDPTAGNPGVIYFGDVGYDDTEELSVVTGPGMNFGWPMYEGFSQSVNYVAGNPAIMDAPNPLFGTGGCTEQYFRVRDLFKEATLGTPSWPNPCDPSQQVPASLPRFLHARPALDWNHGGPPSRTGIFNGNDAAIINIGAAGSPVSGPQFGGNCAVGGLWYQGSQLPATYQNTYFFGDLGGQWIRNATFNAANQPVSVRDFASNAGTFVSIAEHPINGSLYYVQFYDGVRKISYVGTGNRPPTAVANFDVGYGLGPLVVQFTGGASVDPEGLPLIYSWNFGDGEPNSSAPNPIHVFDAPAGVPTFYVVTLTVTDSEGETSSASLRISVNNTPPVVAITSPAPGTKYPMIGDTTYNLAANVVDAEHADGQLLYEWQTFLRHNEHEHSEAIDTNHITSAILSAIGCDGNLYYYRITLRVTDPAGLSAQTEVHIFPDCPNTPPTVSAIGEQTIATNSSTAPLSFTVADMDTPAAELTVSGASSNPTLIPNGNIVFGGTGENRTVTVTPVAGQSGTATITVTVSDGVLTTNEIFNVAVIEVAPPTYLLQEGFEGTGFENSGWAKFGAANEDYAVSALTGAQSLHCEGAEFIYRNFAFATGFNMYFQARWLAWGSYNSVIYWDDAAWGTAAGLFAFDNRLELGHGNVFSMGTTQIALDTTYHIWVEWTKGTGANGTMKLFVSTTGVKPATPEASLTTGNGAAVQRIYFGPTGTGPNVVFDQLLVDDVPIGSNPAGVQNQPPTITNIADQTIGENGTTGLVGFTVGDAETAAGSLGVSGTSSNPALIPNGNIVFGGSGANRTVSVTPAASQSGSATITVTVSDGSLTAADTFQVLVTPAINTPPTITDVGDQAIGEDGSTGAIAVTVGDGESAAGSLILSGSSSNPTLVPNGNVVFGGSGASRTVTVTPAANQFGSATITLTVSDGVLSAGDDFVVTVDPVNDWVTISAIADQTIVTNTSTGPLSFTIADVETAAGSLALSASSSNPTLIPNGNLVLGGSGANRTVTATPVAGQSGTATITVSVSDGHLTTNEVFEVTVIEVVPPTYLLQEGFEGTGFENSGWAKFGAANEDYAVSALTGAQSLHCEGAEFIYRNFAFATGFNMYFQARWLAWGSYNSVIYWDDAAWGTAAGLYALDNRLEIVHGSSIAIGPTQIALDTTYHIWVEWTKGTGANGTMKLYVSTTGVKPVTPEASLTTGNGAAVQRIYFGPTGTGPNVVFDQLLVDDVPIGSNPAGVQNQPPTITNIADQTIGENGTTGLVGFTVGDAETAAGSLGVSGTSSNPALIPNGNIVFGGSGANRTVSVTPAASQSGSATITVTVSDGSLTAADTFQVLVTPAINTPPTITDVGDQAIGEDGSTGAIAVTVGDGESAAGSLILSGSSSNPTLVPNGNVVFGGSGASRTVTVTPAANQFGSATITLTVSDGVLSAGDDFVVTVDPVNDWVTISAIADQTIVTNTSTGPLSFTIADVETAAGSLALSASSSNPTLIPNGNLVLGGSGANRTVTATPVAGQSGTATITVSVSDGHLTTNEVFEVTVIEVVPPTYLLQEGFEGTGFENSGWAKFGAPNEDYAVTALTGAQSLHCEGAEFIYRNFAFATGFNMYFQARWLAWGSYNSVIHWDDAAWGTAAGLYALDNRLEIVHGSSIAIGPTQIALDTTYHIWVEWTKGTGANGTMKLYVSTTGAKPVTPEASLTTGNGAAVQRIYFGPTGAGPNVIFDQFLVDDVPIGNNPAGTQNQPPTISDIADQSIAENGTTGPLSFTVGDPESAPGTLAVSADSSNPTFVPNGNIIFGGSGASRTITVTPAANQSGGATITVTVSDGALSSSDTFAVTADAINDRPSITSIADQTIATNTSTGPLTFTIGDPETAAGSLVVSGSSSNPSLIPNGNIVFGGSGANRTVTVTPAAGQSGTATITVTVSDGDLTTNETFQVNVIELLPPTYLLSEGFEGTGFENGGWSKFGAPNEDYTAGALTGAQSLNCTGAQFIYRNFAFASSFNMYFKARWLAWGPYNNVIYWDDATWGTAAGLFAFDNRLELGHGNVFSMGTTPIALDTTYHIWVEWTKGSGTDGTMKLYVSTTGTKPGAPEAQITAGNGAALQRIYFGPTGTGPNVIFDQLLVDDVPIGSQPN